MSAATYTPAQVAGFLDLSEAKVREIIREESAALVSDTLRFVPGGRVHKNSVVIHRGIYDAITRSTRHEDQPITALHSRKVA